MSSAPRTFHPVTRQHPCPHCDHADNCNVITEDGRIVGHYCRRTPSGHEGKDGGWFHWLDDDRRDVPLPIPAPIVENKRKPAAPEVLDRIYRCLFAACSISPEDHAHLLSRGLTNEQISRHGYRSFTPTEEDRVHFAASMLARESADVIGQVPGLRRRSDGRMIVAGPHGILIPVMQNGLIIGVRIRRTKVHAGQDRYVWLSTPNDVDGCGSGAPAHVAMPKDCKDFSITIVTEGEIKANITADKIGRPVIAVPGVTIRGDVIPLLAQLGAADVWTAYDLDAREKPQVAQAEHKLISEVMAQGYAVYRLTWTGETKIDDALVVGIIPVAVTVSPAENGKELDRLKRLLDEERDYTAKAFAAINSKQNGPEGRIAAAIVHDLRMRRIPVGQAVPMPNARISQISGTSERRISDHKPKINANFGNVLDVTVEHIPRKVDADGVIHEAHDLTLVRLLAEPSVALEAISANDRDVAKNGNGGKREKRPTCPKCGPSADVLIESRFVCGSCKAVISTNETKVYAKGDRGVDTLSATSDEIEFAATESPGRQSVYRSTDEPLENFPLTETLSTADRVSTPSRPLLFVVPPSDRAKPDKYTDLAYGSAAP